MRRSRIVMIVSLLVAIGIPVALIVHRTRRTEALDEYLTERGFVRLAQCDREGPLIERAARLACYAGTLRGVRATIVFVTKLRPGYVPNGPHYVGDNYVAIYLDGPPSPSGPWPAPRVERVGSATVLVWEMLWSVADARIHLAEVEK